jgi:mannose-6-phosphate isomerase
MWYIMEAPDSGSIILGLKEGATPQKLRNETQDYCNAFPVRKGDIVDVPAGLVHALTKGVMVAEIQQNSDTTYRLYDYGRTGLDGRPRELHLDKGLAAVDFPLNLGHISVVSGNIVNPYFTVIKYNLDGIITENSNADVFCIFTCVEGECEINGVRLGCSRSAFIPAGLPSYTLRGKAVLLKSFTT